MSHHRRWPLLLAVAVIGVLPALGGPAAAADGSLGGVVQDNTETAMAGAAVVLRDGPGGDVVATTTTNPDGRYTLAAPGGRYHLEVTASPVDGDHAARVRDVDVAAGATLDVVVVRPLVSHIVSAAALD